jgi:hypothetical protein
MAFAFRDQLRGEELLETEAIGPSVILQFGNTILTVGAPVVVAPDLLGFRAIRDRLVTLLSVSSPLARQRWGLVHTLGS